MKIDIVVIIILKTFHRTLTTKQSACRKTATINHTARNCWVYLRGWIHSCQQN